MTWFKVDDCFYDHPKVVSLLSEKGSEKALNLWLLAGCWSSKQLTDGFVPASQVARLGFKKSHALMLVRAHLWLPANNGFQFHEWEEHQPTREVVQAKREATRGRVRKHREKRSRVSNALQPEQRNGVTNAPPDPTRPDPLRESARTSTVELLRDEHKRRVVERKGLPPSMGESYAKHLKTAARWCDDKAALDGIEPMHVVGKLLDGLFSSSNPKVQGDWGMRFLGTDASEFWPSSKPSSTWQPAKPERHDPTPRPMVRDFGGKA